MANSVYLISEAYLKEHSSLDLNVEAGIFDAPVLEAQDVFLQPLLGTALYKKILADVSTGTITGVYKTLLDDYCQKVVCYYAVYETLPNLRYKLKQKGVVQQNSNFSVQSEFAEFNYLVDTVKNKAEYYSQRLADYLKEKSSTVYPELNQNDKCDEMQPESGAYDCGIFTGYNEVDCERYLGTNKGIIYLG